jgi:hypothetical protein
MRPMEFRPECADPEWLAQASLIREPVIELAEVTADSNSS